MTMATTLDSRSTAAGPIRGSPKGYRMGSQPGVGVAVREIALSNGEVVTLYDTSGPITDEATAIDVRAGLPSLRSAWVAGRGDVEEYDGRPVAPRGDGP